MKKKKISILVCVLVILIGVSICLYPIISTLITNNEFTAFSQRYITEGAKFTQEEQDAEFEKIKEFNKKITNLHKTDEALELYDNILNFYNGAMGVLRIPSIDLELPIYHTVDEESISNGAGHYEYSPIPIGEDNTNSLISSHSGLPDKELFSNLKRVKPGETFSITIMNLTTEYTVDKVDIIKPEELKTVALTNDNCYVSLFTCTPISVNSHRLVVRGVKTDSQLDVQTNRLLTETFGSFEDYAPLLSTILISVSIMIFVTTIIILIYRKHNPKINKSKEGEGVENPDENENG